MLKNLLGRLLPSSAGRAPAPDAGPVPDDVAAADALIVEGDAREDAGQVREAAALYRQAAAKAPGHARAHLNLGIALTALRDDDAAIAAYERVLAIDPRQPFGNYNFARLLVLRGELARAGALVAAPDPFDEFPARDSGTSRQGPC